MQRYFNILILLAVSLDVVYGILSVTVSPMSVLQNIGTTVWVDCIANPSVGAVITWERDGGSEIPLMPASGKTTEDTYVLMNNTLKIEKLRLRQAGTYNCIASSGEETTLQAVKISISYIQKMTSLNNTGVFIGDSVDISCESPLANPAPTLLWLKDGKVFSSPRIDQSKWLLKFKNATTEDSGTYTCVAMGVKNRTASGVLTVYQQGSPEIISQTPEVVETKSAKFVCKSMAVPAVPLVWKKHNISGLEDVRNDPGRVTVENGTLEILTVRLDDEGNYTCYQVVGSQFETVEVSLRVIPIIKIGLLKKIQKFDRDADKPATIVCPFRGVGPSKVSWVRSDTGTLPSHMSVKDATLVIENVLLSDTGSYKCTVDGPYNSDSKEVDVKIFVFPKFTKRPSNVSLEVGGSTWVHCRGTAYPDPEVYYVRPVKGGGSLDPNHFVIHSNGSMEIKDVRKEDVGAYFCWLKNDFGNTDSYFYINLAADKETSSSSPMSRTIGIAVGCAGIYILLVIGLMIYCRARRARLLKGIRTEVDVDGGVKDPLVDKEAIALETKTSHDDWETARCNIEEIDTLGHGKMGRVFKAHGSHFYTGDTKKTLVAVKEFDVSEKDHKEEFNLEFEMLSQLDHENVVKLLGITTDASPWYLISNYGEEGDMKGYLQQNTDIDATDRLGMSICIVKGMDYLVKQGYIHRDLAARNCVVKSNRSVMVSFFSLCEDVYRQDYYNIHEVPLPLRWLSPEAMQSESYSEKSDVWSFAVTVWEVYSSGARPYTGHEDSYVYEHISTDLRLASPDGCPKSVVNILEKCWQAEPENRPSFSELVDMISTVEIK